MSNRESSPEVGSKINFSVASAFIRKYTVRKQLVMLTNNHRGSCLNLDAGHIIIEQKWYTIKK